MDDPPQPIGQRWRRIRYVGGSYRIPAPPGPAELSRAQREEMEHAKARGAARVAQLHLVGLFRWGVIVMGLLLAVVILISVLGLISHR